MFDIHKRTATCVMMQKFTIFIVHRPLSGNAWKFIEKITFSLMLFDEVY